MSLWCHNKEALSCIIHVVMKSSCRGVQTNYLSPVLASITFTPLFLEIKTSKGN